MKHKITAQRLKEALHLSNLKPQELANRSQVGKASISQYINGSHKPSNVSSGKIAKVLGVNPLWLMGFDVPMYTKPNHPYTEVYPRIKDIVEKQNITLTDMVEEIGLEHDFLSDWKNEIEPSKEDIEKIANYLNTTYEYLATGKEDMELTDKEKTHLEKYRKLDSNTQDKVDIYIDGMLAIMN